MERADETGELLHASQTGDRTAMQTLLARYLPGLRAFVRLRMSPLLRSHESSSDLVQDACLSVLQELSDFDYRGEEPFRRFLYVTVLNTVRNHERELRAQKRDARREVRIGRSESESRDYALSELYAQVLSPTEQIMADERMREFEVAFDELPEHYREVITLSRIARLSRNEIAAQMARTEASVRSLLSRALVELARVLKRRRSRESG